MPVTVRAKCYAAELDDDILRVTTVYRHEAIVINGATFQDNPKRPRMQHPPCGNKVNGLKFQCDGSTLTIKSSCEVALNSESRIFPSSTRKRSLVVGVACFMVAIACNSDLFLMLALVFIAIYVSKSSNTISVYSNSDVNNCTIIN